VIPEAPTLQAEIEERLRFEILMADLTARFVHLPPARVQEEFAAALKQLCNGLGLDRSTLWELVPGRDATGSRLALVAHYQIDDAQPIPRAPEATELFPWVHERLRRGEPVVFGRLDDLPAEAERDAESFRKYGTRSAAVLPLRAGGRLLGALSFAVIRGDRTWPEDVVRRLHVCARVFADSIDRRRSDLALRESEEALRDLSRRLIRAHEEERARLARELHDDLTQRLARLAIDLGRFDPRAGATSAAETIRAVRDGLARLSEDIHALAYRLHPTVLEDLGLTDALRAECGRFARQESLAVDVKLHEVPEDIPNDTALCLFRVAQESLRNVARHARARTVDVSLRALDGGLQLAVRDDGIGFDPVGQRARARLGVASMRERVHLVAGELDIDSAPGRGTTVAAWVPLHGA